MPRKPPTFRPNLPLRPIRDESREERVSFYSGTTWRKLRAAFLAANPLCIECLKNDEYTAATIAHHRVERLHDESLAYDWDNLEPYCSKHHTSLHKRRN